MEPRSSLDSRLDMSRHKWHPALRVDPEYYAVLPLRDRFYLGSTLHLPHRERQNQARLLRLRRKWAARTALVGVLLLSIYNKRIPMPAGGTSNQAVIG